MRIRPLLKVLGAVGVLLALTATVGAAAAQALTVAIDGQGTLRITDPEGRDDDVNFGSGTIPSSPANPSPASDEVQVVLRGTDDLPIVVGDGCWALSDTTARCAPPSRFDIDLGAGNDTFISWVWTQQPLTMRDGPGNDDVQVKSVAPLIVNGEGDDRLLVQGAGARIVAGSGADDITGDWSSTHTLDYSNYTQGINVSFDELPNDGAPGEHDNIHQLRQFGWNGFGTVIGGAGNDTISSDGPRKVYGGPGDDTLRSQPDGELYGGDGDDTLAGGRVLRGENGNDALTGGAGPAEPRRWPRRRRPDRRRRQRRAARRPGRRPHRRRPRD